MSRKIVQYDIAVPPVEVPLSDNRMMVKYTYVFPNRIDVNNAIKAEKRKHRKGWKQYDSDSVVYYGPETHLWLYTVWFKKTEPQKRIKMTEIKEMQ